MMSATFENGYIGERASVFEKLRHLDCKAGEGRFAVLVAGYTHLADNMV